MGLSVCDSGEGKALTKVRTKQVASCSKVGENESESCCTSLLSQYTVMKTKEGGKWNFYASLLPKSFKMKEIEQERSLLYG